MEWNRLLIFIQNPDSIKLYCIKIGNGDTFYID